MSGVISGGWEFVIAAYVITFGALAIYGITLITRLREERSRSASGRPTE
ncbi:MAG TPA: hypothetical protein VF057_08455 [Thermoanaerobaculia bacterium]